MENNKVTVISTTNATIVINNPNLRFRRVWERKGAKAVIEKDIFSELMYATDFRSLVECGKLYIEDMEIKKEVGLEPEDAAEPVNIIVLSEKQQERLLKVAPYSEFKDTCEKLSMDQLKELASFAVANEVNMDMNKLDYFQAKTGKDILKAIQLNRSFRAEEARKNDSAINNL
jgi:hypothetical protein